MNIRKAEKSDIPQIAELLKEVQSLHARLRPDLFIEGARKYSDEQLAEILEDDLRPVFLCVDGEQLLGYIFCIIEQLGAPSHPPIKTLYIDDLCVHSTARRNRIGSILFEYARAYAKVTGCYNLTLNVWAGNESAEKFYRKMGMQVQKTGMEVIV